MADRSFLQKNGIYTRPAKKSVLDGITAINQRLKPDSKTGRPRLYIFATCQAMIDELYSYEWHQSNSEVNNKETPIKLNDDLAPSYIVGLDGFRNTGHEVQTN